MPALLHRGLGALVGYTPTRRLKAATTALVDSNANPSGTTPTTLSSGGSDLTVDFGYYKTVTIGDFIWSDTNGQRHPGCWRSRNQWCDSHAEWQRWDWICGHGPRHHLRQRRLSLHGSSGTYTVTVDAGNFTGAGALVGYTPTPTLQGGNPALDSNPNPSGTTPTTLSSGGTDLTADFGYYKPVTIGDFVWDDTNGNGIQDSGEAGINGVTLTLTGTNGAGGRSYRPCHYCRQRCLSIHRSSWHIHGNCRCQQLHRAGALASSLVTPTLQGANRAVDSNTNPSGTTPTTLSSGGSDLTVDFGYFVAGQITGTVFLDQNRDGVNQPSEPGLSLITITLRDSGGNILAHHNHRPERQLRFQQPPRRHLHRHANSAPRLRQQPDPVPYAPITRTVTLPAGGISANQNFGDTLGSTGGHGLRGLEPGWRSRTRRARHPRRDRDPHRHDVDRECDYHRDQPIPAATSIFTDLLSCNLSAPGNPAPPLQPGDPTRRARSTAPQPALSARPPIRSAPITLQAGQDGVNYLYGEVGV